MSAVIQEVNTHESALSILRKRWFALLSVQALLILIGYQVLDNWWSTQFAYRWVVLAAFFAVYFAAILWRNLTNNIRPREGILLNKFGPGNLLTISRGFLLAFLFGFLFSPWPPDWLAWIPGVIYTVAALADLFDGYLARKLDHETVLGEKLDLSLDGLGLLIASILLVQYHQVPIWYLLVGIARYLFLFGIWLWRKKGKPVYKLAENSTRRPFAGAQMGFVAVVLYPLFSPPGTYLAAALFAIPFLIGFLLDWLDVSSISRTVKFYGNSKLTNSVNLNILSLVWREKVNLIVSKWLTLIVRLSLVMLLIAWFYQNFYGVNLNQFFSATISIAATKPPIIWLGLVMLLNVVSLFLIAFGAGGRIASLFLLFGIGIYQKFFDLYSLEVLLIAGAGALFYLGSGPYSLWKPERKIITRRLGEM
jgi:CDP-diacylglycerol--glycerol-3-phosphate 3-phosphatidyltransferase